MALLVIGMPHFSIALLLAVLSVEAPLDSLLPKRGAMAMKQGGVSVYALGRRNSRSVARKYDHAIRAAGKGDHPEAIRLLTDALGQDAGNKEAQNDLGVMYQALGDHAQAAECFALALAGDPDYALAHLNMTYSLAALHRFAEAERAARAALRAKPDAAAAHFVLGLILISERRFTTEALASLRLARREFPEALIGSASILLHQGNAREAQSDLRAYMATARPEALETAKAWLELAQYPL